MSFDTLPLELQNILLANHSYISKWLFFIFLVFMSAYYIFVIMPNQKQTKFFSRLVVRVFFMALSFGYLAYSPYIFVTLMSPEYSFYEFVTLPLIIYGIIITITLVMIFVDLIRYGPFVLLKLAGLDVNDKNANEIARNLENLRFFLKMGKKNGR